MVRPLFYVIFLCFLSPMHAVTEFIVEEIPVDQYREDSSEKENFAFFQAPLKSSQAIPEKSKKQLLLIEVLKKSYCEAHRIPQNGQTKIRLAALKKSLSLYGPDAQD